MWEQMKKYKYNIIECTKNHKKICNGVIIIAIILIFLFFIIFMPLILNKIYYSDTKYDFFYVGYNISDILVYYGAILTFIGTISLGIITVYQNHKSQKKTDEVNRLTLELQKRGWQWQNKIMKKKSYMKLK